MRIIEKKTINERDNYLVKITKEVEDRGAFATIDYRLYTGASMPTAFILEVKARDRFKFEEEIEKELKRIFKKYKYLEN